MKSRYRVTAIAVLLLAAVGFAPQAEAVSKPPMSATNATVTADAADQPGRVAYVTLLSTGFEPGQGFVVAALEPQQGWVASGLNAPWASVSAANPHSGAQHQRLQFNGLSGAGVNQVVLSPLVVAAPNSPSTTTQWINISNDQGADYDVFGQAPSQAFITWRVKFHFSDGTGAPPGTIFILDDLGGGALAFINTGIVWNTGVYTELKVQFDPAMSQIRYFYDGALIHTGVTIYAGNVVEQVGSVNDNFQLGGETADFDDIVLIDTPTDPTSTNVKSWGRIKKSYR